jgi:hypothetical protein
VIAVYTINMYRFVWEDFLARLWRIDKAAAIRMATGGAPEYVITGRSPNFEPLPPAVQQRQDTEKPSET